MRVFLVPIILFLIFSQLPFGPSKPEEPEEEPSPVKGWWLIKYFGIPPTQYSSPERGIIKAESVGSRASLFKEVRDKEKELPILSWKWKISNVVRSAIETKGDRFDAAAKVIVVFGKEKISFEKRRGFGIFGIVEPVGLKIEYIWATRQPKGHIFDHPKERNSKVFVLESGEAMAGKWVYEERDIHKDFKKAFGKDFLGILAIGIQTDTDNSNEMVTAYYSEPRLKKR